VEERYQLLTEHLQGAHERLAAALEYRAPALYERLVAKPPTRVEQGYQLLPEILADELANAHGRRAISSSYSWPHTLAKIDKAIEGIELLLERRLDQVSALPESEAMPVCEKLVAVYEKLEKTHETIERHIQHNRLWQPLIHRDRARFDRATELYDAVLERDALLQALAVEDDAGFRQAVAALEGPEPTGARKELEAGLQRRERALRERVRAASQPPDSRDFVHVEHPERDRWMVEVTVYTDIEDQDFLVRFEEAVERHWHVRRGEEDFRVDIVLRRISTETLYRGDEANGDTGVEDRRIPGRGDQIDLAQHVALFADDGAALTSGANAIQVMGSRCIVLSPLKVAPRTLAHEFGHVLGFRDEYVRGYRDLGREGYEILEVAPEPENIMASPGYGQVHAYHFEALLAARHDSTEAGASADLPGSAAPAADSARGELIE
jgi:hypothetical protein